MEWVRYTLLKKYNLQHLFHIRENKNHNPDKGFIIHRGVSLIIFFYQYFIIMVCSDATDMPLAADLSAINMKTLVKYIF